MKREERSPGGNLLRRAVYPHMIQSEHAQGGPLFNITRGAGELILKCANGSQPGGFQWACNDSDVLEYPPSIHNRGRSTRREQAMPDLKSRWLLTWLPPWWNGRHQSSRLRLATALDVLSAEQECGLLTLSQISCRGTMSGILSVRDASTPKPRK